MHRLNLAITRRLGSPVVCAAPRIIRNAATSLGFRNEDN